MGRANVVVDNRVAIEASTVPEEVVERVKEEFTHKNPKKAALESMGIPSWKEPRFISTWALEEDDEWLTVPRGGLARVERILWEHGLDRDLADDRVDGDADMRGVVPAHRVELYPHQEHAVRAALEAGTGIIRAPTGSGKTCCGFALAARTGLPTLVVVSVRALFDQWLKRAQSELGLRASQVGVIRGSRRDIRPLTIAMQGTLAERGVDEELACAFGCVICDEVQLFAARTFFAAVDPFRARYRIGISADHRRKDRKEFLTLDLFGDVVADIDRAELEDQGRVLDVVVRVVPTSFEAPWYGMPDDDDDGEGEERELDVTRLLEEMAVDPARNELVARWVGGIIDEGHQVLVMSHRREHCQRLAALLVAAGHRAGFLIGGDDYRQDFKRTLAGLEDGSFRAGVGTYQAIGQGIDMPAMGHVAAATPIAANRQYFGQVRGRACRVALGKKGASLVYFWDRAVFGLKHVRNLVRWNRTVLILDRGQWVEGREFLKMFRRPRAGAA